MVPVIASGSPVRGICFIVPTGVDGAGHLGWSLLNGTPLPDFVNTKQPTIRG